MFHMRLFVFYFLFKSISVTFLIDAAETPTLNPKNSVTTHLELVPGKGTVPVELWKAYHNLTEDEKKKVKYLEETEYTFLENPNDGAIVGPLQHSQLLILQFQEKNNPEQKRLVAHLSMMGSLPSLLKMLKNKFPAVDTSTMMGTVFVNHYHAYEKPHLLHKEKIFTCKNLYANRSQNDELLLIKKTIGTFFAISANDKFKCYKYTSNNTCFETSLKYTCADLFVYVTQNDIWNTCPITEGLFEDIQNFGFPTEDPIPPTTRYNVLLKSFELAKTQHASYQRFLQNVEYGSADFTEKTITIQHA